MWQCLVTFYTPTFLNPIIPLLGVYFTGIFVQVYNACMYKDVNCSIIYMTTENNPNVHQTNNKLWHICTIDHYTAIKKNVLKWKDLQETVK